MQLTDTNTKDDLMKRLRRIEGQTRGVEKMVDENRDCREVLQQLTAIKSAVQQVSLIVARSYACQCLEGGEGKTQEEVVEELIAMVSKTA